MAQGEREEVKSRSRYEEGHATLNVWSCLTYAKGLSGWLKDRDKRHHSMTACVCVCVVCVRGRRSTNQR